MFRREARLPVDVCFPVSPDGQGEKQHTQYVKKFKRDLQEAFQLASNAADKVHERNRKAYNSKVRFQNLDVGDRVLLRNLGSKR